MEDGQGHCKNCGSSREACDARVTKYPKRCCDTCKENGPALTHSDEFADDAVADCCGVTSLQSDDDGFGLTRVGRVIVCGECLLEAGVIEDESG